MTHLDNRGLPLSTSSAHAAERYCTGIDLFLSAWPGDAEALDEAIDADPDFALAHAARARLHTVYMEGAKARDRIAQAETVVARHGTERERSHVAILSLTIHGQAPRALEQTLAHAEQWPRDIMILTLPLGAFGLFAFSGMADHDQARVDFCKRHARHLDADDWCFLTYLGWAHTENGNVALGRSLTERGLELHQRNGNAAHALVHAMHEAGEHETADRFITDWLPGYQRAGLLHGHIAWHQALTALEQDDPQRALAIYADSVQPSVSRGVPINVMSDSAAFLWRLQAYGHGTPHNHWEALADYSSNMFRRAGFAFADVHMAIIAAATGDRSAIEQRVAALTELVDSGTLPTGPVVPAICRAALAFADEDYASCARILEPVATEIVRIGGSGAQREMIEDMLLLACMRSGASATARELLDRRLHRRPAPRDTRWRAQLNA